MCQQNWASLQIPWLSKNYWCIIDVMFKRKIWTSSNQKLEESRTNFSHLSFQYFPTLFATKQIYVKTNSLQTDLLLPLHCITVTIKNISVIGYFSSDSHVSKGSPKIKNKFKTMLRLIADINPDLCGLVLLSSSWQCKQYHFMQMH